MNTLIEAVEKMLKAKIDMLQSFERQHAELTKDYQASEEHLNIERKNVEQLHSELEELKSMYVTK